MPYLINEQNTARFLLGDDVRRPLLVFSLNPSTATDRVADPTNRKIRGFAERDGYEGYVLFNLYPQRTPYPQKLHKRARKDYREQNIAAIRDWVSRVEDPVIWAAWGNPIEIRPYLPLCLQEIYSAIEPFGARWIHRGSLTKGGHPRHPSRLAYAAEVKSFDVEAYLKRWL